jgi:Cu/Ag efflux protein CusF
MKTIHAAAAALAAGTIFVTVAVHAAHVPEHAQPKAAETAGGYVEGEVRKVDKDAGKITLRHGPIANLEMPAMSMVFRAKEPGMLDAVKEGDKVRFKAEKIDGAITIVEIQQVK